MRSALTAVLATALTVGVSLTPALAPAHAVTVKKKHSVTARISTAHVDAGGSVRIRGKVAPAPRAKATGRSKRVRLQERRDGRWTTVKVKRVKATGAYRFKVRSGQAAGLMKLRVRKTATPSARAGVSSVRRVHVLDCADPEATGTYVRNRFERAFAGHDFWYEAPNFEKVARPMMHGLRDTCEDTQAQDALSHVNVVGVTWRALSGWLDE